MSREEMKLTMKVNGLSKVPPGFRFHPTEEELLHYYLRKKVAYESIDLDVIQEVDLNKLEPWDIQEKCNLGSNAQNDWYFFSHKDKKYPSGTRTNRATAAGFWKATGRDKVIHSSLQRIGMRKTLVFYKGRAPHGQKSDWIMHEYRLDDIIIPIQDSNASSLCDCTHEEGWVVCRLFKKKHYHKSIETPKRSLSSSMDTRAHELQSSNKDGVLEQLLAYMDGRSCMQEIDNCTTNDHGPMEQFMNPVNDIFVDHLPRLESPAMTTSPHMSTTTTFDHGYAYDQCNWVDVDKFLASQLDVRMEETKHVSCYGKSGDKPFFYVDHNEPNEEDIWSLDS